MANVIKTVLTYPLDGSNRDFNIPFEYLARKFVVVTLIGVDRKVLTLNTDYRFATRTTISLTKAWGPADGYTTIELRRVTSTTDRLVDFTDGSILRAYDLNVAQIQTMHVAEEARDLTADTIGVNNDGHLDARGRRIVNLANAVDDRDAVPFGQLKTMNQNSWQARNEALQFRNEAETFRNQAEGFKNESSTNATNTNQWRNEAKGFRDEAEQFKNTSGQYADAAGSSAGNAKDSEDEARRIAASIKAFGKIGYITRRSFEKGFNVTTWNEALLWEEDGDYYRWDGTLPKNVPAGSTPETAGGIGLGLWVSVGDMSLRTDLIDTDDDHLGDALIAIKQPYNGSMARTQHSKNLDTISVKDFGATGDGITDDTAAIQYAFDAAHSAGRKLYFPAGVYQVSSTLTAKLGTHYSKYGLSIEGEGRGASVIQFTFTDTDSPVAGINLVPESGPAGYNFDIKDMTLKGTTAAAVSSLIYCTTGTSGIILNHLYMHDAITAFHTPHDCWISEFHNLNMSCRDYGIRMDASGTTNRFDGCFVHGAAVSAYKLRGGYSTIGALAADDCTGTIYDLQFFEGSAQSLGSEQPSIGVVPDCIVNCDNGIVNIDYLLGLNSAPVDGTTWYAVKVGSGTVDIKNLLVSSNTGSDSSVTVTGGLISGYRGPVTVQNIVAVHKLWSEAPVPLTFSTPLLRNSPWKIKSTTSTEVAVHQAGKPYIGFGAANAERPIDLDGVLSKRNLQAIYMDSSGDPRHSGVGVNLETGRDKYKPAPAQGSWFMENDPLTTGRVGYACSVSGIDISSSSFLGIPAITTTKPTSNLIVGQSFFSVWHNRPLWWNGSNWVDATGATAD